LTFKRTAENVNMKYGLLDTVVLNRDLPDLDLREGDLGVIVHVYELNGIEVEFVTASGRTGALATLTTEDVRPVVDADLVSVRSLKRSASETGNYTEERREMYSGLELDDLVTEIKRRRTER
jgi:hypothetical protein